MKTTHLYLLLLLSVVLSACASAQIEPPSALKAMLPEDFSALAGPYQISEIKNNNQLTIETEYGTQELELSGLSGIVSDSAACSTLVKASQAYLTGFEEIWLEYAMSSEGEDVQVFAYVVSESGTWMYEDFAFEQLNEQVLKQGLTEPSLSENAPYERQLLEATIYARENSLGIWQDNTNNCFGY